MGQQCLSIALTSAALLAALTGCGSTAQQAAPAASASTSAAASSSAAEDPARALRSAVRAYVGETYGEDAVGRVTTQKASIDVKVHVPYSAQTPPDDVAAVTSQAKDVAAGLPAVYPEGSDQTMGVVSLVDDDDNNLVVVDSTGKIMYSVYANVNTDGASASDNAATITLDEFNQIQVGMDYQTVFDIVGSRGTVLSEAGEGDYYSVVYAWDGEGMIGANANVSFQGGYVFSKAQFGLE